MAMANLLIKTLGAQGLQPKKFLMILDNALKSSISSFQIMPSGLFSVDSGEAGADVLQLPDDSPIFGEGPDSSNQSVVFELDGAAATLSVGMQGTGSIGDNANFAGEEVLIWKVISIAGPPPPGWSSMDIFQDLPAPPDNIAVA